MRLLLSLSSPELEKKPYTGTQGLYSAVTPDERSAALLQQLAAAMGFKNVDPAKLHCTVMYSRDTWPKQCSCNPNQIYTATVDHLKYWGGHDDKGYIVAVLKCPALQEEHERFKRMGCTPTFEVYEPHVTLWAGLEFNDVMHEKLNTVNSLLRQPEVVFSNQFIGDLKDD